MLVQKISRAELAKAVGVKLTTLGNIIRGGRCSEETRRKITSVLRARIWDDIPTDRNLLIPATTEIESFTIDEAIECEKQFPPELVRREGNVVFVLKPIRVVIEEQSRCPAAT